MPITTPSLGLLRDREYTVGDLPQSPLIVFYEVTRACDLVCRHCRACAQAQPSPGELSTEQSMQLIAQLATFPRPPLLVLTGGDPLKRADIFGLIRFATDRGMKTAVTPSATALVTSAALRGLRELGIDRLAVSLDGVDAPTHDSFRGVARSYQRTLEILKEAGELGLPLQVNTTLTRRNIALIDGIADLLSECGIVLWSVFFLVPVGRGALEQRLTAEECESAFERLWRNARRQPYLIKTTEAPHYRRYALQQRGASPAASRRAAVPINDGKGILFVSHEGQIFPSGFLPLGCGSFPRDSVVEAYQSHPTFVALREPAHLKGKCGACEFRQVCGGSRARAFAVSGDPWASDPDCAYVPARQR